ncbi:MAG TPA: SDR family NAD(P)-dependent oxidoreductase, partial [Mycobacterium sp.]|nr:SDR family NAD(P)-dependent oxidoreductase [Mycobacterium sp.]
MRFHGRTAFITGAATGLGRAFARALTDDGAAVVIADVDAEKAEHTATQLNESGGRAFAVPCDVTDEQQVEAAVAGAVARFGGIDILI